jgi:hypothetical protein
MDHELWATLKAAVNRAIGSFGRPTRRCVYSERLILLMYFWAVWHDRCLSWACDPVHYGSLFRPRRLPSISRFTRRVKTQRFQQLLQIIHDDLATRGTSCPFELLGYVDGKALAVSPVSKDPDARCGRVSGGFGRGYKLHAWINEHRRVVIWCVSPLNLDEKRAAAHMLHHLPRGNSQLDSPAQIAMGTGLTLGDKGYDSRQMQRQFDEKGRRLITPLLGEKRIDPKGQIEKTLRAMGSSRRELVEIWKQHRYLMRYVMKSRNNAEGTFSVLSLACGLDRLPGFVRRLERVRRWVGCKLILYHARLLAQAAQKSLVA